MSLIAVLAVAVALGWYAHRISLLWLPILAVLVYGTVVLVTEVGRDAPIVALAILVEVGLAAGLSARRCSVSHP